MRTSSPRRSVPKVPGGPPGSSSVGRSGPVGAAVLEDGDAVDRLAVAERDVAKAERVGAREGDGDVLLDLDGALRADLDADVALDELVRAGVRDPGERERREQADGDRRKPPPHATQPAGAPGVKVTWGGSRCASSSTSKNSRLSKPKKPAKKTPGTVWIALLKVSTVSL